MREKKLANSIYNIHRFLFVTAIITSEFIQLHIYIYVYCFFFFWTKKSIDTLHKINENKKEKNEFIQFSNDLVRRMVPMNTIDLTMQNKCQI